MLSRGSRGHAAAVPAVALMPQAAIMGLNGDTAILVARAELEHILPPADSTVLAHADDQEDQADVGAKESDDQEDENELGKRLHELEEEAHRCREPLRPEARENAEEGAEEERNEDGMNADVVAADCPHAEIRAEVRKLCAKPGEYWRKLDRDAAYPAEFVAALADGGYLSARIPEEYGGSGLPFSAAAAILEEVQRAGYSGAACHAQMYHDTTWRSLRMEVAASSLDVQKRVSLLHEDIR